MLAPQLTETEKQTLMSNGTNYFARYRVDPFADPVCKVCGCTYSYTFS